MRGKLALTCGFSKTIPYGRRARRFTIPVSAAPPEPKADDFFVKVEFFDKRAMKIQSPAGPGTVITPNTGAIDWFGGGGNPACELHPPSPEPGQSTRQGQYYGQIVEPSTRTSCLTPGHVISKKLLESRAAAGLHPLFLKTTLIP
jgi:hypothetical protein